MKNTGKRIIALLLTLALAAAWAVPAAAESETAQIYPDLQTAAAAAREQMTARQQVISVTFPSQAEDSQLINQLLDEIFVHTGVPNQGDYLRHHCKKCSYAITASEQDPQLRTVNLTFTYRTTAAQEAEVDAAVDALLEELALDSAGDYHKISAVYDYICSNVTFDNFGYMTGSQLCFTTYGALVQKAAVCQGYATLFYRLALELGVDARVIAGTSKTQSHGWNIVRLGNSYYNMDTTWDATQVQSGKPYLYFLQGSASFPDHTPKEDYTTEEFTSRYPIPLEAFSGFVGDANGDMQVDEDDAIYLLLHVLMPDAFPAKQDTDYTLDGKTDEDDAIYLLQHVLMPDLFPL